jgi:hypothetical protein
MIFLQKIAKNWMKNKNGKISVFVFCWPLSIEFISETNRDRGNPSTYCQKLTGAINSKKKIASN